jgi:hypothetical protein
MLCSLNLVILRTGHCYGPFTTYGISKAIDRTFVVDYLNFLVPLAITVISVYGYMKKPFKCL